jgi:hypothetical protein
MGLSPTFGINYNIHRNILIGLESNLSILERRKNSISVVYSAP